MKIAESVKKAAKNKKIVMAGAVIFIVCAGALAYFSGLGGKLLKTQGNSVAEQGEEGESDIQQPDRDADIVGIVESVEGNQVKIMKLNASDLPGGNRNANGSSGNNSGNTSGGTNSGQSGRPTNMPQGGPDMQGGSDSSARNSARAAMLAELKKKSIGEETITVPVGIQMMKMGGRRPSGNNTGAPTAQNNQNEQNGQRQNNAGAPNGENKAPAMKGTAATISDLTVDSTVKIWLNSKAGDQKVAEFVSIMG